MALSKLRIDPRGACSEGVCPRFSSLAAGIAPFPIARAHTTIFEEKKRLFSKRQRSPTRSRINNRKADKTQCWTYDHIGTEPNQRKTTEGSLVFNAIYETVEELYKISISLYLLTIRLTVFQ